MEEQNREICDKRDLVYEQDCEMLRYQDKLQWSRMQTAATIEGAYLLAVYTQKSILSCIEFITLLFSGLILVSIVSLLSIIDQEHGEAFLNRIKEYEKGKTRFCKIGISNRIKGKWLLIIAAILLFLANIIVIFTQLSNNIVEYFSSSITIFTSIICHFGVFIICILII